MRLVAIHQDCYECSGGHDFLMIPDGLNLKVEADTWRKWYRGEYCGPLYNFDGTKSTDIKPDGYIPFTGWLKNHGAIDAEIEVFEEP